MNNFNDKQLFVFFFNKFTMSNFIDERDVMSSIDEYLDTV